MDTTDPGKTGLAVEKLLLLREVEEFLMHEADLLDERRFEEWTDLFTDDGTYWAPATVDQESPDEHVSLFFDDKALMRTRVERLRHPRIHSQIPPSRTSHMVGNIVVDPPDATAGAYRVRARFRMLEFRPGMEQRTFGGRYDYELVREGGSFRIRSKKASLINCDDAMLPISLPF